MALKSERFEMRLGEDILTRIDKWRSQQDDLPSRAEAVRSLVEVGLSRHGAEAVTFTDGEKVMILMMRDLLRHLKVEDGETDADFMADVILGGHYWAPKWHLQGVFHGHEDELKDVHFVANVLDMWNRIEGGYAKLSKTERERVAVEMGSLGKDVRFRGFDGNNEAALIGIARFLVEKMDRFGEFKNRDLNAHMPTVDAYRRMFVVFEPMKKALLGDDFSANQIIKLLKARFPEDKN